MKIILKELNVYIDIRKYIKSGCAVLITYISTPTGVLVFLLLMIALLYILQHPFPK